METFELGSRKYFIKKMDVFKQFHTARRIGPILASAIPTLQGLVKGRKEFEALTEEQKFEKIAPIVPLVMNGIAKLSDEDADFVLHRLLECVEVDQGKVSVKLFSNGTLMFQDLELPALMMLAGRAFMLNLSGFFSALPQ